MKKKTKDIFNNGESIYGKNLSDYLMILGIFSGYCEKTSLNNNFSELGSV